MSLVLRYAARSDVGKVRSKNDDSAYVGRYLAVVADGMGGHAGGDVASASTVLDLVHLDRGDFDQEAGTVLADEIQTANSLLSELVHTNPRLAGMGTTVTAILLSGRSLQFAHIGDSRAYRLKNGVFEQISIDHTFVQRLIDEGRLRPEEAETHPHKNVLMRVLGDVDASPELDLRSYDVEPGERWLLCSDGLNAVVRDSTVEEVMRSTPDLQACVDTLVDMVLAGGAPDNVTIAVVEVAETTPEDAPAPIPAAENAARTQQTAAAVLAAAQEDSPPGNVSEQAHSTDEATEAIRADAIREDLSSRPHKLVGAAALATQTGQIPIVTKRSTERRAAMVLTHKSPAQQDEAEEVESGHGIRRWLAPAFLAVVALALTAAAIFGYSWTQTRYYVAAHENRVAIFNGVSQTLGPFQLSHVDTVYDDIPVDTLPEFSRQRLASTLPARDFPHAQQIVEDLRRTARAVNCPPSPSPSGKPSSTPSTKPASPRPSTTARGTASGTASAKPTSETTRPPTSPSPSPAARTTSAAAAPQTSTSQPAAGPATPIECGVGP